MNDRIRQEITYTASPDRIYEVLTTAALFSQMSGGAPAEIDATDGGAFSVFGGMIQGRTIECVPGKRLVQAWRAKNWAPGLYSVVHFELRAHPEGAQVALEHAGYPEGQGEHLAKGWHDNYWNPLKALLSAEG
jgi:activator of HSP90 ATPase